MNRTIIDELSDFIDRRQHFEPMMTLDDIFRGMDMTVATFVKPQNHENTV